MTGASPGELARIDGFICFSFWYSSIRRFRSLKQAKFGDSAPFHANPCTANGGPRILSAPVSLNTPVGDLVQLAEALTSPEIRCNRPRPSLVCRCAGPNPPGKELLQNSLVSGLRLLSC